MIQTDPFFSRWENVSQRIKDLFEVLQKELHPYPSSVLHTPPQCLVLNAACTSTVLGVQYSWVTVELKTKVRKYFSTYLMKVDLVLTIDDAQIGTTFPICVSSSSISLTHQGRQEHSCNEGCTEACQVQIILNLILYRSKTCSFS